MLKEEWESYVNLAQEEDKKGNFTNALNLLNKALVISGDECGDILYKIVQLMLKYNYSSEALSFFIKCYKLDYLKEATKRKILNEFYLLTCQKNKDTYLNNIEKLKNYEYKVQREFPEFEDLKYYCLCMDDNRYIVFEKENSNIVKVINFNNSKNENMEQFNAGDIVLIINEFNNKQILEYERKTYQKEPIPGMKKPLYLFYSDFEFFLCSAQLFDLAEIFDLKRLVFLFGINDVEAWFAHSQTQNPSLIQGNKLDIEMNKMVLEKMGELHNNKLNNIVKLQTEIDYYYSNLDLLKLYERLKNLRPRILFITSRFTTFLQYCIRDCVLACTNLNIPCDLLIEESDIYRLSSLSILDKINEFKPDLIIMIDHFAWEYPVVNNKIIFITWIQDPLPQIMDVNSPSKLGDLNFIISPYTSYKEFDELGYPEGKIIKYTIPVNHRIYKYYKLNDEEINKYSTDITYIANGGNAYYGYESLITLVSSRDRQENDIIIKRLKDAFSMLYDVCRQGKYAYSNQKYMEILNKCLGGTLLSTLSDKEIEWMLYIFRFEIEYNMHISVPLEWLDESKYKFKLWGKSWSDHPILSKYSMGSASNGEEVSKIYNSSKIGLGLSPYISMHYRYFEVILSNCMYIGRSIPGDIDTSKIKSFFIENKEMLLFDGKDDMFNKIDYCLNNSPKRSEIIELGTASVLEKYTYEGFIRNILEMLVDRLRNIYKFDIEESADQKSFYNLHEQ